MEESLTPIRNPYPVPTIHNVTIAREPGQSVGVNLKRKDENTLIISGVEPGTLLSRGVVGKEILAINGEPTHSPGQAARIIRACPMLDFTMFDSSVPTSAKYCYLEVAPTSKISPGVSFDSCYGRTLVMISEVFLGDLTKTRLRPGDIVLAVNGVPVWKPEQADEEQIKAARDNKALVLYCVAIDKLHEHFVRVLNTEREKQIQAGQTSQAGQTKTAIVRKKAPGLYMMTFQHCKTVAKLDGKTQLFDDETDVACSHKTGTNTMHGYALRKTLAYEDVCSPTHLRLNKLVRDQLDSLRKTVVEHAWAHQVKASEEEVPTYLVPSASLTPTEIPSDLSMLPIVDAVEINSEEDEYRF